MPTQMQRGGHLRVPPHHAVCICSVYSLLFIHNFFAVYDIDGVGLHLCYLTAVDAEDFYIGFFSLQCIDTSAFAGKVDYHFIAFLARDGDDAMLINGPSSSLLGTAPIIWP